MLGYIILLRYQRDDLISWWKRRRKTELANTSIVEISGKNQPSSVDRPTGGDHEFTSQGLSDDATPWAPERETRGGKEQRERQGGGWGCDRHRQTGGNTSAYPARVVGVVSTGTHGYDINSVSSVSVCLEVQKVYNADKI